jgi:autotransporter passenger strand-loop-strand repeat protein
VRSGGVEDLFASGTANFTTVSAGGNEYVSSGGMTNYTTLSGGTDYVEGGIAVSTTVADGGSFQLGTGALAVGTTVDYGIEDVFGGTDSDTTLSSGSTEVVEGGTAVSTTVALGGMIDVAELSYVPGGTASVTAGDMLSVTVGRTTYTQQLAGVYSGEYFQVASSERTGGTLLTLEARCYRGGTQILTDRGEVAVEALRIGDLVQTALREAAAPIIWIGHRNVDCARHPKPRQVWPVRVANGAFGPGRPHSDLFLSPDHAVYVGEVLIPVKHLINNSSIAQVPVEWVKYYHFDLPQHDVVLAQGLPAESFLDIRDGPKYANRPGPVRLYPDHSARMWEAFGCARLIVTGQELVAARALIESFAKARASA